MVSVNLAQIIAINICFLYYCFVTFYFLCEAVFNSVLVCELVIIFESSNRARARSSLERHSILTQTSVQAGVKSPRRGCLSHLKLDSQIYLKIYW